MIILTPNVGDLIFVHATDPIGYLIEWAEDGRYSHVALYIGDGKVIEARGWERIRCIPLSDYRDYDVGKVNLTDAQRADLVRIALTQQGTHYDFLLILIIFLRIKLRIKIPYKEKSRRICSTFIRWCFQQIGVVLTNIENCTPEDLADSSKISIEQE